MLSFLPQLGQTPLYLLTVSIGGSGSKPLYRIVPQPEQTVS